MIDLHLHTRASDGTWTAEETVREALRAGLGALAITDHDSVASVAAGMAAAARLGLRFLSGVELTASWEDEEDLHILGYGVDLEDPALRGILDRNQAAWAENERQSLDRLASMGVAISAERYAYWREHTEQGGWPTLNCLKEMGLVQDYREYFAKYFGPGRPAHVHTRFAAPAAVVDAVHEAGGVAILAHPGAYDPENRRIMERSGFLEQLVEMGLDGCEAIANENTPAETEYLLAFCRRRGLVATGGSDCHGRFVPDRFIGRPPVPDGYLPPLLERLRAGSYV